MKKHIIKINKDIELEYIVAKPPIVVLNQRPKSLETFRYQGVLLKKKTFDKIVKSIDKIEKRRKR